MEDEQIELPPGFRFHPTDEELITHYLSPKVVNTNFNAIAIGEADLNKSEPWDLPGRAKMGEKEWYFFCVKDRKYPTGLRTNRATESGYWKATGKDKEILRAKRVVGMKKTLVFYKGRAPKGQKSNWVMHEYRLEPKFPISPHLLLKPTPTKNEWVICRIFNKSSADKRTHISELVSMKPFETDRNSPALPPLMDYSHSHTDARASRVTCFSNNPMDETKPYISTTTTDDMLYNNNFKTAHHLSSSSSSSFNPPPPFAFPNPPPPPNHVDSVWMHGNNSVVRMLSGFKQQQLSPKVEISSVQQHYTHGIIGIAEDEDQHNASASDGPIDLDSLWDYY